MDFLYIDDLLKLALKEDINLGDITTENTISEDSRSTAKLIAKRSGVVAGLVVCERVFHILDASIVFDKLVADGASVEKGTVIAQLSGPTRSMLKGERVALNFLERLSGIATRVREYVQLVEGTGVRIVDTRKTTPGLRYLEKYAVRMGGGTNHRFSLSDGVLIKDNHIKAAGGITAAVSGVRKNIPHTIKIEVETEDLDMVREALDCKADIIMLDNMDHATMKEAVGIIAGRALVEASGNVNRENIRNVAETGVDIISIGEELTQSIKILDISMRII